MKRELLINVGGEETRVALLEDDQLAEILLERSRSPSILGNIYRGRVSNILPGMQSLFVDIGLERDAFLYAADILLPHSLADPIESPEDSEPLRPEMATRMEDLLSIGKDLLVQVVKEAMGSKGPRVTTQISLPGRQLVFLPGSKGRAVSRRLDPAGERDRVLAMVESIPGEGGFIGRTAAAGSTPEEIDREASILRADWESIRQRAEPAPVPSLIHRENDLILRCLRDLFTPDTDRVIIDDEPTHRRCRAWAERRMPALIPRLEAYHSPVPLFEGRGLEREIRKSLRQRVWLPSGGYLVIHPTEALVAIDVNTGKYVGKRRFEETALRTNLEAAREIVRQIRLRDLGGILVIDFIDLVEGESRRQLAEALETELKSDRARSRVLQISEFGLVEITRQRVRQGLEQMLCQTCPTCRGSGRVRSALTLRLQIEREIHKTVELLSGGSLRVRAHPEVSAAIDADLPSFRAEARIPEGVRLEVEAVEGFHPEEYEILTD